MRLRFAAAILLGKFSRMFVRLLGFGAGTAIPGLVATAIDPRFLARALQNLPEGYIAISGTNGKTTTARMIHAILVKSGKKTIANKAGSNLLRGITSTFIEHASILGNVDAAIGVWEADEATLPLLTDLVPPRIVVLLNLFRDQLDRYGEVETLRQKWARALARLPKTTILILNADDPSLVSIVPDGVNPIFFGINEAKLGERLAPSHRDVWNCYRCGRELSMTTFFAGHLSHFSCPGCRWGRPAPSFAATRVTPHGLETQTVAISTPRGVTQLSIPLPGLPAVYSALASLALSSTLRLHPTVVFGAIAGLKRPFGRWEELSLGRTRVVLNLMKNPAATTASIRTLEHVRPEVLMLVLNDLIADGTDVSWIWDVPFSRLPPAGRLILSGTRAADLAVRIKYAAVSAKKIDVIPSVGHAIDTIRSSATALFILATYTGMLNVRSALAARGSGQKHLEDEP